MALWLSGLVGWWAVPDIPGLKTTSFKHSPVELGETDIPDSRLTLFWNTWLVTASNPKGIVFFVAFLPQFISPDQAAVP